MLFSVLQEQLAWDDEIVMSLPLSFSPSPSIPLAPRPSKVTSALRLRSAQSCRL